jgi:hypothetical protein
MIRALLAYCTTNAAATAGISAFAGVKATADNKLILIDTLNQLSKTSVVGVTLDTTIIRQTMTNIALKCGDAVSAYASSVNNNTLRQAVTYTYSVMSKMKKEDIDDICQQIHDAANTHIAAAGAFGYDATDVTDLATAINLYRTSMQNPRAFTVSKKQANANIKTLVREIVDNLFERQMDRMAKTLRLTNPEFVQGYFFSREIINLGTTTAKVRGSVKNNLEEPLVGVAITMRKTGQLNKTAETLSGIGGKYTLSDFPADDYDIYWQFPGYQAITETNVHIAAGKEIRRNITMQSVTGQTITLQGFVRNEENNMPVQGAIIDVGGHTTVSQSDGSYFLQFSPAASPNYPYTISANGFETNTGTYTIQPGQTNTQDILLVPVEVGSISGLVTASGSGMPVNGAFIQLVAAGNTLATNSDINGNYNIPGVPVNNYTATISAPGFISQQHNATIMPNTNFQLDIILVPVP